MMDALASTYACVGLASPLAEAPPATKNKMRYSAREVADRLELTWLSKILLFLCESVGDLCEP